MIEALILLGALAACLLLVNEVRRGEQREPFNLGLFAYREDKTHESSSRGGDHA